MVRQFDLFRRRRGLLDHGLGFSSVMIWLDFLKFGQGFIFIFLVFSLKILLKFVYFPDVDALRPKLRLLNNFFVSLRMHLDEITQIIHSNFHFLQEWIIAVEPQRQKLFPHFSVLLFQEGSDKGLDFFLSRFYLFCNEFGFSSLETFLLFQRLDIATGHVVHELVRNFCKGLPR